MQIITRHDVLQGKGICSYFCKSNLCNARYCYALFSGYYVLSSHDALEDFKELFEHILYLDSFQYELCFF